MPASDVQDETDIRFNKTIMSYSLQSIRRYGYGVIHRAWYSTKQRIPFEKKTCLMRFAVLGDAFVDVLAGGLSPTQGLPNWGADVECHHPIQPHPGGSALNTATHLSALSREKSEFLVDLHTIVGDDFFGKVLRQHVDLHQIALRSPCLPDLKTGVCIVLSNSSDRGFVTYYGAMRVFALRHVDRMRVLEANHLHIGGYFSCPQLHAEIVPLLKSAKEKGITISLDTNYDTSDEWDGGLIQVLPFIDVFLPNEAEAKRISRGGTIQEAFTFFDRFVDGLIVIKMGNEGVRARCSRSKRTWFQPTLEAQVQDVTGAGDSFNAGFLFQWKQNSEDVENALLWGSAVASRCVAEIGASTCRYAYDDIATLAALN
uniref:Adenosine kinase n=1 Tax=Albugo laibachii Nc14 TaxID=890382 RepID=F0WCP6_9STRA|nr:conserved hypothetical protein [Albugo laibachii Nc14]CCA24833.1 conserved hypothetical protein [Albugo laibachii Nc14]|eukprot:CCA24833.1 conserved hypothetical protein [Albugo laibachii Nc14]